MFVRTYVRAFVRSTKKPGVYSIYRSLQRLQLYTTKSQRPDLCQRWHVVTVDEGEIMCIRYESPLEVPNLTQKWPRSEYVRMRFHEEPFWPSSDDPDQRW